MNPQLWSVLLKGKKVACRRSIAMVHLFAYHSISLSRLVGCSVNSKLVRVPCVRCHASCK